MFLVTKYDLAEPGFDQIIESLCYASLPMEK